MNLRIIATDFPMLCYKCSQSVTSIVLSLSFCKQLNLAKFELYWLLEYINKITNEHLYFDFSYVCEDIFKFPSIFAANGWYLRGLNKIFEQ